MDTITFVTFHIITAGAKSENVGAAVFVGFEGNISFSEEIEEITLIISDAGEDAVDD